MINKVLKRARNNVKLSQADAAESLGYSSPQFISNWERGVSLPPLKTMPKVAKLYKLDQDKLRKELLRHYNQKILEAFNA